MRLQQVVQEVFCLENPAENGLHPLLAEVLESRPPRKRTGRRARHLERVIHRVIGSADLQVCIARPVMQGFEFLRVLVEEATADIRGPTDLVEVDTDCVGIAQFRQSLPVLFQYGQHASRKLQRIVLEIIVLEVDPRPTDDRIGIEDGFAETLRIRIAVQELANFANRIDGTRIRRTHGANDGGNRNALGGQILQYLFKMGNIHLIRFDIGAYVDDIVHAQPHPGGGVSLHEMRLLRADDLGVRTYPLGHGIRQHAGEAIFQPVRPTAATAPGVDGACLDGIPADEIAQHTGRL